MQEVSRGRSTSALRRRKGQIQLEKLNPNYISGFIDGEGSFSVSFGRHKTLKRKIEIRIEFAIELRKDDEEILHRIKETIGCGRIYDCSYDRYGWYPHAKYKIGSIREMKKFLLPFLRRYPLQAKKAKVFELFSEIVEITAKKDHLKDKGFKRIFYLRNKIRKFGKKHNWKPPGYGKTVRPVV